MLFFNDFWRSDREESLLDGEILFNYLFSEDRVVIFIIYAVIILSNNTELRAGRRERRLVIPTPVIFVRTFDANFQSKLTLLLLSPENILLQLKKVCNILTLYKKHL